MNRRTNEILLEENGPESSCSGDNALFFNKYELARDCNKCRLKIDYVNLLQHYGCSALTSDRLHRCIILRKVIKNDDFLYEIYAC